MVFDYYRRLSRAEQQIYRRSDAVSAIKLPNPGPLRQLIAAIERELRRDERGATQSACQALVAEMNARLDSPPARVSVLEARPSEDWGELHGLYEPVEENKLAHITVWMRTARRRQVVAFRTFLRTVLHEYCHHLDYEHFNLADSFHTEGFYKRESSLFRQLVQITDEDQG